MNCEECAFQASGGGSSKALLKHSIDSGHKTNSLEEGLKIADFISIHSPLTKETKNLINIDNMKLMKKNSILINTARGGIINELDLNQALNEKSTKSYIYCPLRTFCSAMDSNGYNGKCRVRGINKAGLPRRGLHQTRCSKTMQSSNRY